MLIYLFDEVSVKILYPFLKIIFVFLQLCSESCLENQDTNHLSDICFCKYFPSLWTIVLLLVSLQELSF